MPDLGSQPTRTSVVIRQNGDGRDAKIAGATEKQAGVMTADQAYQLNQCVEALGISGSNPVVQLHAHAPIEPQGAVRGAMVPKLDMSLPAPAQPAPHAPAEVIPPDDIRNLASRLMTLERNAGSLADIQNIIGMLTALRDEVSQRLVAIEARLGKLETETKMKPAGLPAPVPELDAIRRDLDALRSQQADTDNLVRAVNDMINDPTPVLQPTD